MKLFLYLVSLFWLLVGLTALIKPLKIKAFYSHIIKLSKPLFILPLAFGILFLLSVL